MLLIIQLFGILLVLSNTFVIVLNGAPLIVSSYPESSVEKLVGKSGPLWVRLAFGFPLIVQGPLIVVWAFLVCTGLFLIANSFINPRKASTNSLLVGIISLLSFGAGGGFIIGAVLGFLGGMIGFQSKILPSETFIGRILRALRLDKKLFLELKEKVDLSQATSLVIIISFLSALGCSIFAFNVERIHSSLTEASSILLYGQIFWDNSLLYTSFSYIWIGIVKWLLLSAMTFLFANHVLQKSVSFENIAKSVAFSLSPMLLQIFLPFIFFNEPYLSYGWPLTVYLTLHLWSFAILVIATSQLMDISTRKSVGLLLIICSIYWFITYKILYPIIETSFKIPQIVFEVQPFTVALAILSFSAILAYLLGTFRKEI